MRRVLSFYKFVPIEDPQAACRRLQQSGDGLALKGTILVAGEGVNGTLVGTEPALARILTEVQSEAGPLDCKWSDLDPDNAGFYRYKVRVKPEIVSFGVTALDLTQRGEPVDAERWHALLDDPDVVVIDTRNQYEIDIGTFPGAVSPRTTTFREFPAWAESNLPTDRRARLAMFCTGGIRCEKASAYLRGQGYEQVYQLDGGVLRYLETVAADENRWRGECFVFDQRVSLDRTLQQGGYQQCFACRHPLSEADLESPEFEQGVSCPHCIDAAVGERRDNLRERQRQVSLAEARGERHIGAPQPGREGQSSSGSR